MGARDRAQRRALRELAQRWEELSEGASTASDWGPDVFWSCAQELKKVLDQ